MPTQLTLEKESAAAALRFTIRLHVRGPNLREHHMARARRIQTERTRTSWAAVRQLGMLWQPRVKLPAIVTFTRVGVRLLDDDNLAAALKGPRDQIAAELAVSDAPNGPITWVYRQRRGPKPHAVEVEIAPRGPA